MTSFNLGNGYENVYTAIPGATGGADTVTDTLVTPFGNVNLDSLFGSIDAAAPMQPGDAFTGLEAGDISSAADAFSIGGVTLDPTLAAGGEGFDPVTPLASSPPLLELGGGSLGNPDNAGGDFATQSFDVYSGSGSGATEVGSITTGEDITQLLGLTNTQLIVSGATAANGAVPPACRRWDRSTTRSTWAVDMRTSTPLSRAPAGADTVTDTLVTPFGNVNLDSLFSGIDAGAPMQPGDAFTGLEAGDSSIGADAFTIGSTTFDPITSGGTEGYDAIYQILGAPPLLEIGGGTPDLGGFIVQVAPQDFNVYDGSAASATRSEASSVTRM